MINLQFNLRIPGSSRFKNIKCWHSSMPVVKNKFWEIQVYQSADIFDLFLRITRKESHSGMHIDTGLLGFNLEFQIYDNRHWNKETNDWYK